MVLRLLLSKKTTEPAGIRRHGGFEHRMLNFSKTPGWIRKNFTEFLESDAGFIFIPILWG
jgi:hypothetical protein